MDYNYSTLNQRKWMSQIKENESWIKNKGGKYGKVWKITGAYLA